jgi:hypothetical protein
MRDISIQVEQYHKTGTYFTYKVYVHSAQIRGKALKTENFSELLNIMHYQGQIKRVGPTVFQIYTPYAGAAGMLLHKNSSMMMMSVSENFLVESEWFFTK